MPRENLLFIDIKEEGDVGLLNLRGELIAESRIDLERVLRDWKDAGRVKAVANCANLTYLDSAGLSTLLGALHRFRSAGGDLILVEMNPSLNAIFELTSMEKYFKIFPMLDEALAHFKEVDAQRSRAEHAKRTPARGSVD